MKKNLILILVLVFNFLSYAQSIKIAILDFENISGIVKYDGLGKAMSSMLISDIEANVSPKRLQLVERAQIQKVLKEQNFQTSGSVNKSTAVQAGKILGVNYLLVGDVYILNDQLIINARLTNAETGDIVFSKKQEGKTLAWLTLKTNIAKDIAASLSQPFTEPTIPDKEINVATITTFGNAVAAKDTGNVQLAETLSATVLDFNPEFKYIDDLRKEIDELKKQVIQNTKDIESLKSSGDLVINASTLEEFENNLKSDLISKEEKLNVFIKMIQQYSDILINKPLPYDGYGYEINFANQLDYNSIEFIDIQLIELEKLSSKNQKTLLIKLIRGELIYVLSKYDHFFSYKIPENLIIENKLVATINLYKKCLSKYQQICHPDIPINEIYFLELFVPFKMMQNCYIEASFIGVDTIFFNSNEFKSLQNDLVESFITDLTEFHNLDNRITDALLAYKKLNGIDYYYWNLLLFIYFSELNTTDNIYNSVMTLNDNVKTLKNIVGNEYNLRSYSRMSIPLIIDKSGVKFNK
jgi:TolB-like protein